MAEIFLKVSTDTSQSVKNVTDLGDDVKAVDKSVDALGQSLTDAGTEGIKSLKSMRMELKELAKQIDAAGAAGDVNLAKKLQKQFGELRNDIADTSKVMTAMDPGELLNGFVKMGSGAVGAFGAITGGMSLLGVESESLQAIEKKGVQLIQFMMGLEQARQLLIDNGARKQNAQYLKTFANQVKSLFYTNAQTVSTVVQTTATEGAAVAQVALNTAMKANPIAFVIAGVVALGAALTGLIIWLNRTSEAQKTVDKAQKEGFENYTKEAGAMKNYATAVAQTTAGTVERSDAIKEINKNYGQYIGYELEDSATNAELYDAYVKTNEAMKARSMIKAIESAKDAAYSEQLKAQIALDQLKADGMSESNPLYEKINDKLETQNETIGLLNKTEQKWLKTQKETKEVVIDKEKAFTALNPMYQKIIDAYNAQVDAQIEADKKAADDAKQLNADRIAFETQYYKDREKLRILMIENDAERAKSAAFNEMQLAVNAKKSELDKLKYIGKLRETFLKTTIDAENKKYLDAVKEIDKKVAEEKAKSEENIRKATSTDLENKRADIKANYKLLLEDAKGNNEQTIALLKAQKKEEDAIDKEEKDKRIELEKKYWELSLANEKYNLNQKIVVMKVLEDIRYKQQQETYKDNAKILEALKKEHEKNIADINKLSIQEQIDQYKKFVESINKIFASDSFNLISDSIKNVFVTAFASAEKAFEDFTKEGATDLEKLQSAAEATGAIINSVFDVIAENLKESEEAQLTALDERFEDSAKKYEDYYSAQEEAYKEMLDANTISQVQYDQLSYANKLEADKAKKSIDDQKAAEEKRIKRETFETERQASISQAAIAGLVGAIEALPNYILAALVAVTTAVDIGMISAEKNPYAKGGKVKGPGDGKSDSIDAQLSNGEFVVNANSTKIFEPLLALMNGIGNNSPQVINQPSLSSVMAKTVYLNNQSQQLIRAYVVQSDINDANVRLTRTERRSQLL